MGGQEIFIYLDSEPSDHTILSQLLSCGFNDKHALVIVRIMGGGMVSQTVNRDSRFNPCILYFVFLGKNQDTIIVQSAQTSNIRWNDAKLICT